MQMRPVFQNTDEQPHAWQALGAGGATTLIDLATTSVGTATF